MFTVQATVSGHAGRNVYGYGKVQAGQVASYVSESGEITRAEVLEVHKTPAGVWMAPVRLVLPSDAMAPAASCQMQLSSPEADLTSPEPQLSPIAA